jgi:hypothetical protein
MVLRSIIVLVTGIGTADAQDLRPLCADRPGLDTPACTVDPGRVVVELGGADWTLNRSPSARIDTLIGGDLLARYGVTANLEVQGGWAAFGTVRTRDAVSGRITRNSGIGDVTVAARRNLSNPDGSGFSAALMPYATLPTGGTAIGAGDWSAGLIIPLSYGIDSRFSLALTPEIDAAVDGDRHGRHLAYGSVVGLGITLGGGVSTALELQVTEDEDPAEHTTAALAGLSFAWQPRGNLQFDAGAVAALNEDSPDVELYVGVARRF